MEYSVRLGLVDNLTANLNKANAGIQQSVNKVTNLGKSLAGLGVTLGVGAVLGAVKTLTDALEDQATADKRVNDNAYSYGTALGYTQEQIDELYKSTLKYAGASQDKGVFGDEELERMMAQNMEMGVQADLLETVGDLTRDYTVHMKGAGASQEDLLEANKKINSSIVSGTLPTLKKFGITLGDITAEQFKNMTQQERATAIMNAFNKASITGSDTNARNNTVAGHFTAIKKNIGDIIQEIAKWTLPAGLSEGLASLDQFVLTLKQDFASVTNPIDLVKLEIGGMIDQFTTAYPHLSRLIGLLGTIGGVVGGFYALYKGAMLLVTGFATIKAAASAAWLVITANPVVFAIYAVIAILVVLYTYWDEIKAIALSCWDAITSGCQVFIDYAVGAWQSFSDTVSGVFDAVAEKARWLYENTPLKSIVDGVQSVKDWVSEHLGGQVPKHATGTNYWRGGLTSVNEHGGEIMNLPNGTQIIPHDVSQKMVNGGNNVNVTVNVAGNVVGNDEFINQLGSAITSRVQLALSNC